MESSIPLYESVSEAISFRLAARLRKRGVEYLLPVRDGWVLDLGSGPGVSSRMLLEKGFERIVALDPSLALLKFAKADLGGEFHPVVGVSENIPFRIHAFKGIVACFSLRDVRNLLASLRQVADVTENGGRFAIVDVGKPDSLARRSLVWLYVRYGMPLAARVLVGRRILGNPFRMIIPTFHWLVSNRTLVSILEREFGPSDLKEFMFGGLVVIVSARQRSHVLKTDVALVTQLQSVSH